jgi:predicted PhzF superfamily epimerase YddE/YHI9
LTSQSTHSAVAGGSPETIAQYTFSTARERNCSVSRAAAFEVRAFFSQGGATFEDPVTGSLNASLAHWFFDSGQVTAPYVVSQGTAIGREGRVHVERDPDGTIWVGGNTISCVEGTVEL